MKNNIERNEYHNHFKTLNELLAVYPEIGKNKVYKSNIEKAIKREEKVE